MRTGTREIMIGAGGTLIAALVLFVGSTTFAQGRTIYEHGKQIFEHVDEILPVSQLRAEQNSLRTLLSNHEDRFGLQESNLARLLAEVDRVRRELDFREVRGNAAREIGQPPVGENRIYINTNSDARFLYRPGAPLEENRVLVSWQGRQIEAVIRGTITDPKRQDLLCKLNTDTARELGLTERTGIARGVVLQRLSAAERAGPDAPTHHDG